MRDKTIATCSGVNQKETGIASSVQGILRPQPTLIGMVYFSISKG